MNAAVTDVAEAAIIIATTICVPVTGAAEMVAATMEIKPSATMIKQRAKRVNKNGRQRRQLRGARRLKREKEAIARIHSTRKER